MMHRAGVEAKISIKKAYVSEGGQQTVSNSLAWVGYLSIITSQDSWRTLPIPPSANLIAVSCLHVGHPDDLLHVALHFLHVQVA
jgi:hypothetical protein